MGGFGFLQSFASGDGLGGVDVSGSRELKV